MKSYVFRILELLVLIFTVAFFLWGVMNYGEIKTYAGQGLETYGSIGILIAAFLLDLLPQYVTPHMGIISAPILGINIWLAFALVAIGSTLGSALGFEIGVLSRKRDNLAKWIFGKRDSEKVKKALNEKGKWVISLAAVSPVPYIPLLIGALYIKRRTFWFYGVLPRVIGFFVLALIVHLGFY